MAKSPLEQRVSALERDVAELRSRLSRPVEPKKDIHDLIGMFDGDEVMGEILAEALKYRERDRRKARRRTRKRRASAKA